MRVLIITFEFVPFSGGIANYTHNVAKGLANLDCDVRVLAPHYSHDHEFDRRSNFRTVRMNVGHGTGELTRFVPGIRYLNQHLREFKPDVALLTSDLAHGVGSWSCARYGVPFVAVVHGSEIVKHFPPRTVKQYLQSRWLRSCYTKADAVFCVSNFVKDLMLTAGFDESKLIVIHNGVDDALIDTPSSPTGVTGIRNRYTLNGKTIILTIARLVPRKGQAQMIKAMPAIRMRHPEACYLIVGTGDDQHRLGALAKELGVEDAVVLTGEIPADEKIHFLDLCDVYVLPSRSLDQRVEGLGIALLEAAARGKPLIATRHGGINEIIDDGANGYLIDTENPGELAERVVGVLDDPNLARRLGAAAKRSVIDSFLATRMAEQSKHHLASAMARGAGKSPIDHVRFRSPR